ncbi:MAG TPA: response regulator [Noviherbaspirillum sp.]|jgi:CheY-like chemotaxis protein|uniref:response regulator n=1 Tax=Noviherbaspirillum sp. TaxID=1926288 RepID=UPI002DDD5DAC|nr:response regulator [Noviherbaspirillum sp.]HEV2612474.1 response regulator [Noviherbaspirillum sp.]
MIGFSSEEEEQFDAVFTNEQGKGYGYFRLQEDNLRDPDIYLANGLSLRALVRLSDLRPSGVRPALLVGKPDLELPYPYIGQPVEWHRLFEALDDMVEKRADALSRLEASDVVTVPERRRRDRLDLDLRDPAEYERMRAKLPENGMVLVVDKNPMLSDHLGKMVARYRLMVDWVSNEAEAVAFCKQQSVAILIVNTSTASIDAYRLCRTVKDNQPGLKIAVIFLTGRNFSYDLARAREAGADGYLTKPLVSQHLLSALKKFLPNVR